MTHLDVLPTQTAKAFDKFGIHYRFIKSGLEEDRDAPVQIASIQTLPRCQWWKKHKFHVVILDEVHKVGWSECVKKLMSHHCPDSIFLGLTGSPWRLSKREGMGDIFDTLIAAPTPAELMEMGFLVPGRYYGLPQADLDAVGTIAGDYNEEDLAVVCNRSDLVQKLVDEYKRLASDRTAVVFAVNVAHARAIADAFKQAGITAGCVDGETPKHIRQAMYEALDRGALRVLTSCNVLSEGFDVPSIGAVILARPTKSKALYFQQLGRGLRTAEGKQNCIVLDQSGNVRQFGFAEDLTKDDYSLSKGRPKGSGEVPKKECPDCSMLMPTFNKSCPGCGYHFPGAIKAFQSRALEEMLVSPKKQPKKVEDPIAPLKDEIDFLRDVILQRGNNIASLRYRVEEKLGSRTTHADWLYVAKICGYDRGWAWYRYQDCLNQQQKQLITV